MRILYEREMLGVYIKYFSSLLEGYNSKDGDIFEYFLSRLKEDLTPSMDKILSSTNFLSFLCGVDYVKKTKSLYKRSETLDTLERFREILKKFLNGESFPESFIDDSIYSSKLISEDWYLSEFLPLIYDDPDDFMKKFKRETNKFLMRSIINISEALGSIGVLKSLLGAANYKAKQHYVSGLVFSEGEKIKIDIKAELIGYLKDEKLTIQFPNTIYEMFSEKYLQTLKTQQLIFIDMFWGNKFCKMLENILFYVLFFANRKTLLHGVKNDEITLETLRHFLDEDMKKISTQDIVFELKKHYDGNAINSNYYEYDMEKILPIYAFLANSYILKDLCLFFVLESEGEDKSIKNYGVDEKSINNPYMMTYVWDLPHYNLPITIHCAKKSIVYYFKEVRKENKIRTYIGFEDFFSDINLWKNSFLFPVSPDKVEYLKSKSGFNKQLAHLLFIQTGIWPEHMREKGKVVKRYISVDDIK